MSAAPIPWRKHLLALEARVTFMTGQIDGTPPGKRTAPYLLRERAALRVAITLLRRECDREDRERAEHATRARVVFERVDVKDT